MRALGSNTGIAGHAGSEYDLIRPPATKSTSFPKNFSSYGAQPSKLSHHAVTPVRTVIRSVEEPDPSRQTKKEYFERWDRLGSLWVWVV
jgi:hypothetical protein